MPSLHRVCQRSRGALDETAEMHARPPIAAPDDVRESSPNDPQTTRCGAVVSSSALVVFSQRPCPAGRNLVAHRGIPTGSKSVFGAQKAKAKRKKTGDPTKSAAPSSARPRLVISNLEDGAKNRIGPLAGWMGSAPARCSTCLLSSLDEPWTNMDGRIHDQISGRAAD